MLILKGLQNRLNQEFLLCTLVSVNSATLWQFPSWEKAEGSGESTGLLFWVIVLT